MAGYKKRIEELEREKSGQASKRQEKAKPVKLVLRQNEVAKKKKRGNSLKAAQEEMDRGKRLSKEVKEALAKLKRKIAKDTPKKDKNEQEEEEDDKDDPEDFHGFKDSSSDESGPAVTALPTGPRTRSKNK